MTAMTTQFIGVAAAKTQSAANIVGVLAQPGHENH